MKKIFHLSDGEHRPSNEVEKEIALHLELRAREFEAQGLNAHDARQAALNAFGNRSEIENEVSDLRATTIKERRRRNWLAEVRQDIAIGVRGLRRAPAFTLVALLTLGIGIGANTAIFSVLRSVLLRPLPYANAEQLVQVWSDHRALGRAEPEWLSPPDFIDWRDGNQTFSGMAAYTGWAPDMTGNGEPQSLGGAVVSGNYFSMLGAHAAHGRLLTMTDDDAGAAPVAVISDALWKRVFGADTSVLGRQLTLNGNSWTVVGILPPEFRAPLALRASPEIFHAIRRPATSGCTRGCISWRAIGRLKPDVTLAAATADLARIASQEARDYPETNAKVGVWLVPLQEQLFGSTRPALFALSGAVAFVLLIGCVNLANLLLVRGATRTRELGVRAALGAGKGRMVRQLLTENLVLAATGGALGIAFGFAGSRVMSTMLPDSIRNLQDVRVDWQVLAFAVVITLASSLLFGVLPALQASGSNLINALRSGSRETSRRSGALRSGLVVAQLSLAVVLLVGAGLFLKSFARLQTTDLGFRSSGVSFATVGFPSARYDRARAQLAGDELVSRLRASPAFRRVEVTDLSPLSPGDQDISPIPVAVAANDHLPPSMWIRSVSPGYLPLMQMRLVAGRQFDEKDGKDGAMVAILNEEAARQYFPGVNALGRVMMSSNSPKAQPITIVGIVKSARHDGPNQPFKDEMFLPRTPAFATGLTLVLEPSGSLVAVNSALLQALRAVDPLIPMPALESIDDRFATSVALTRLYTMLVTTFAIAALLLAVLGVYGVMAYTVEQRRREIGVRMALGAQPSIILSMVLSQGGKLALGGAVLGVAGALLLSRLVQSLLFGVSSFDVPTFAAAALLLAFMTVAAALLPARRAMRVDPLVAIRES